MVKCCVAGQGGAECEVVPDVAVAGREALVQKIDGARPAVHRFMVRGWLDYENAMNVLPYGYANHGSRLLVNTHVDAYITDTKNEAFLLWNFIILSLAFVSI